MKTKLFYFGALLLMLSFGSCETDDFSKNAENSNKTVSSTTTNPEIINNLTACVSVNLMAGQHHDSGDVNVYFDVDNVYVEYITSANWLIKKTHLYVGAGHLIPKNNSGNPIPGQFPISTSFQNFTNRVVYTIPKTDLPECFSIAAHAEVVRMQNGTVVQSETAWGQGTRFTNKSWAMYFSVCQYDCFDYEDYYFGSYNN
jgi:hypothetical protein